MALKPFPVVYHSLEQIVKTLRTSEISKTSEVHQLLKVCSSPTSGILDPHSFYPKFRPISVIRPKMPFIVMEGLDGSGKTKVSTALSKQLDLERYSTPPESIKFLKEFFDEQREPLRRAYYSIGNYLGAQEVSSTKCTKGIMMDRFWHSTAAYGASQRLTLSSPSDSNTSTLQEDWYHWPEDLLKPQLVIFLVVSEKVRQYRHAFRNTTNTKEEQALATNASFRESLISSYRKITGPPLLEINADIEIEEITREIHHIITQKYPMLLIKSHMK